MRKKLLIITTVAATGIGAAYIGYRVYFPKLIASSLLSEHMPSFIPKRVKSKIQSFKEPLNDGAMVLISTIHEHNVPFDEVLTTIDDFQEDDLQALLSEIKTKKPKSVDEFFDVGKKYLKTDFDPEDFRPVVQEKVTMKMINQGMWYAKNYKRNGAIDFATAKSIFKRLLIQKEDEFNHLPSE